MNSLPKTVARQHRGCDLNPGPTAAESSTLTTRLLSKRAAMRVKIATAASAAGVRHGLLELLMRSRDWRSMKWGHWDTAAALARYAHYVRYGIVECGSIYPVSRTSAPDHCITDQRYFRYESHFSFSFCYTHTRLTALCPELPGCAGTRKGKPIWILLKQETVSGSGISWAVCKSAPRSRQVTMPAPHHSVFYRPHALLAAQPTASKH